MTQSIPQTLRAVSEWLESSVSYGSSAPDAPPEPQSEFDYRLSQAAAEIANVAGLVEAALSGGDAPAQGAVPAIGDYVLATKWGDGDPGDAWAVGFYDGVRNERHMVKDSAGNQCRAGGYRMVGHVKGEVGAWLLGNAAVLEKAPPGSVNLWHMLGVVPVEPSIGPSTEGVDHG